MIIKIELVAGPNREAPTKRAFNQNLAALERAINKPPHTHDTNLLRDIKTIMQVIQAQLPE